MLVKFEDGSCRSCGGQLEVVDVDDATLSVDCAQCGDSYDVEPDAFGDGCMTYYFPLWHERLLTEENL